MKKLSAVIIAIGVALPRIATAQSLNGVELDKYYAAYERVVQKRGDAGDDMDFAYFVGYIVGIADSLAIEKKICIPARTGKGQVADVVGRSNRSMPQTWKLSASTIVTGALLVSFPCSDATKAGGQ